MSGCIVFGIEKEENLLTSNYWGGLPMVCMSCNSLDAISFNLAQGNYMGFYKSSTALFRVEIHIENNIFKVMNDNEESVMQASVDFKGPNYRFFINNYSGSPFEFSLKDNFFIVD